MQKGSSNNDVKRVRFHASSITTNKTPKGTDFGDIPDVIVLYITEYDALGNNQAVTLTQRCQCVDGVYKPIMDGETIFFANTAIKDESEQSELLQLFLNKDTFENEKFPALSEAINYFKETEEGEFTMCETVEKYAKEKILEVAKNLLQDNISVESVVKATGLSTDEVEYLLDSLNN